MNYEEMEFENQDKSLCLIASENYPNQEILDASGSIFQNVYAEGFPNARYYQGTKVVDKMEQDCIDTCLRLFNAEDNYFANVQPNSGASANMIVYNAVLEPNDTVLAMDVKSGGHISHSHPKSFLAKYHNVITYGLDSNNLLDYEEIEKLAKEFRPKLIIAGASNYSQDIDFKKFKEIADKVGAYLMADIAHISILCAHGLHQSPVNIADFITFTTHKCMAGTRGGCIIYKKEFDKIIKLSTIPSLFGGSLQNQIYSKLKTFQWALTEEANRYSCNVVISAQIMATKFKLNNIPLISGGTKNHLMTVDLSDYNISGKDLAILLETCGIICNCNAIPNDKRSFLQTSGIRLGTPAIVKRGLSFIEISDLTQAICDVINCYKNGKPCSEKEEGEAIKNLKNMVQVLTKKYPLEDIYCVKN